MKEKRLFILYLTGLFLVLSMGMGYAQRTLVKGTIVDANSNTGIPGVNVVETGTNNGTVTDINGVFSIEVAGPASSLEFSYVGYLAETILVGDQTQINVALVEDVTKLDEVVVIGYGTQRKSDLTGSVSVVNTENLEKIASTDIAKVLQGQTAGVQVFGAGEPGAVQKVQIRGVGTFGNTDPLYVIDGVPVAAATNVNISGQSMRFEDHAPGYGYSAPSGGIADFNPDNIESVQVLKDASAAAIYGSRGANGVIIITTKRGKAGTPRITYDGNFGFQSIAKRMELTNTIQFQEINNAARLNDGSFRARTNNPIRPEYISPDSIDTDWQKEFFNRGHITNHTLSLQGGTEASNYYASINYYDQTGVIVGPGPRFTKYAAQLNMDQKKGRFKFGQSFAYSHTDQIRLTSTRWNNILTELVIAIPTVQLYDTANIGGYGGGSTNHGQIAGNPVAFNNLAEVKFQRHRFLGVIYGEFEILKSLSYRINLSYDRSEWHNMEFVPTYNVGDRHTWEIPQLNEWRGEQPVIIMENLLNFKKVIGKHDITAVAGHTVQKDHIADIYAHAEWPLGYEGPYKKVISGVSSGQAAKGTKIEHTMVSYLARVNYSYADRYLFTASGRKDFSSNFGPLNKSGVFPSFAIGWKLSNESFFDVPFITMLKFRGGWGKIGNENIGAYAYETLVNSAVNYILGGTLKPGTIQTVAVDPSIKWEERVTTNIGFDMAMLKNKLELSAEYYHNEANDILMPYPIPISSGAIGWEIRQANVASMTNKGIEINLSYRKLEGDLHYQVSGNMATLKNEVTKIAGNDKAIIDGNSISELGRSLGELYGWQFEGIFQSTDQINTSVPGTASFDPNKHAFQHGQTRPGDVMFKDINGRDENNNLTGQPDGQIDDDDKTYLGVAIPKLTYGLNLSIDYKGFDLSVFFQGIAGNKVYNSFYQAMSSLSEGNYSVESYENYWRDDADDALDRFSTKWPRPTVNDHNQNNRPSDRWIQNGSYLKLQNVQLGYSLPKSILGKVPGIENLRIFVQGQNLFSFTKLVCYDPDYINNGLFGRGFLGGSFPAPRTFMVGIKLGL